MRRLVVAGCFLCSAGCTTVPRLEEATGSTNSPVLISEVVKRIKCELADGLADKIGQPGFEWMSDWTAKVDLTLQANDQGGVTPGVSYTSYYRNAFNTAAGSTSPTNNTMIAAVNQFFSFGAGANLGEQAIRAEVVSFTLSLRELRSWKYPPPRLKPANPESTYARTCPRPNGIELTGNLGLREWFDAALYPVAISDLQAGNHPSPVTTAKPSLTPVAHTAQYAAAEPLMKYAEALDALKKANETAAAALKDATKNAGTIHEYATAVSKALDYYLAVLEPGLKAKLQSNLLDLQKFDHDAMTDLDHLKKKQTAVASSYAAIQKQDPQQPVQAINVRTAQDDARDADADKVHIGELASEAAKIAGSVLKIDPPIHSLLHSVEFIVTYGASLAPNWTLIAWKGPSTNGSTVSASGQRTNTLNIAIGPVGNAEQNRLIQNQTVSAPH